MIEYFKTFNPNKEEKTIADMAWRKEKENNEEKNNRRNERAREVVRRGK